MLNMKNDEQMHWGKVRNCILYDDCAHQLSYLSYIQNDVDVDDNEDNNDDAADDWSLLCGYGDHHYDDEYDGTYT